MTPDQFTYALGIVESSNNPNAPLGDAGRALGRYQCHPDFVWQWAHRLGLAPQLNETWDSFLTRLVVAFYNFHAPQNLTDVQIAMTFHEGHITREGDPSWDAGYALRFADAVQRIMPA